jgi:hypothetical protein
VQVTGGSEYTMPNPGYAVEGAAFDFWEVNGNGAEEPFAINAGDTLIVAGNMTATASWAFSDGGEALDYGTEASDASDEVSADDSDNGLDFDEVEEVQEEVTDIIVEDDSEVEAAIEPETVNAPSEVGSVFSGAGVAAIVAAVALVIAAAAVAVIRKKKK